MFGAKFTSVVGQMLHDTFPTISVPLCYGSQSISHQQQRKNELKNPELYSNETHHQQKRSWFNSRSLNESQLDFIFVVNNTHSWHTANLIRNPTHYSFIMRHCGSKFMDYVQELGCQTYYNCYVRAFNQITLPSYIKYGVISNEQLISDLIHWDTIYIAGRMQKPLLMFSNADEYGSSYISSEILQDFNIQSLKKKLKETFDFVQKRKENESDVKLRDAMLLNWDYATRIALLLLMTKDKNKCECNGNKNVNETIVVSLHDILLEIVSLSYMGDIRMKMNAEVNEKFENIVNGSWECLLEIYLPFIHQYCDEFQLDLECDSDMFQIKVNKYELISRLPSNLVNVMSEMDGNIIECCDMCLRKCVVQSISHIISHSSKYQILKSFVMNDWNDSAFYVAQKFYKSWNSRSKVQHQVV